jgi:hypothetical protein
MHFACKGCPSIAEMPDISAHRRGVSRWSTAATPAILPKKIVSPEGECFTIPGGDTKSVGVQMRAAGETHGDEDYRLTI